MTLPGAAIVLDDAKRSPLNSAGEWWTTELTVSKDGRYRIELQGEDGKPVTVSPDYFIKVVEDQATRLSVLQRRAGTAKLPAWKNPCWK